MDQTFRASPLSVAVIGDRSPRFVAQDAIDTAIAHSAASLQTPVDVTWFPTPELERNAAAQLQSVDAIWCAPGSPYVSMTGALEGIRFAREENVPFLGTCAGFQHGVVEFARNVLGVDDAQHGEYDDRLDGSPLFIDELLCSLVGETMTVDLVDDETRAAFGSDQSLETYYCRFGLNESYRGALGASGLVVGGTDSADGTTRILRHEKHPFFYLTLFVPQTASTPDRPHPLITRYLAVALARARRASPSPTS